MFPKSSQLFVSGGCPETKLLIIPAKDTDELDIMEDEVDDVQCELVSSKPDYQILWINTPLLKEKLHLSIYFFLIDLDQIYHGVTLVGGLLFGHQVIYRYNNI